MKRRILMTLVLTGCLVLAGCGSSASTISTTMASSEKLTQDSGASVGQDTKKVTIKFGNTAGEDDIQTMALREVVKRLSEESGGRIEAEIYPSSLLGDTDDLIEQVMQGTAILTVSDPNRLVSFVSDYGMLQMPYIFDDYTELDKVMETELYAQWEKEPANQGIRLITSNWFSDTWNLYLNKEVNVPADLNGQRTRTTGDDLCTGSVRVMGAVPTPMSWSEVYTSIQQKVLDGAEVQTPFLYAIRLWEVTKYINKTEHFQLIGSVVASIKFRDSLSEEGRALMEKVFREVSTEYQQECVEPSKQYEKEMAEKCGVIINNNVDTDAFKEASTPVYAQLGYEEVRSQLIEQTGK